MKHKHNAGYSLVETVVAIAILAIIVTPISTGMVLAFKMNAKTEQLMQAELAVSSAVEMLMANGIDGTIEATVEQRMLDAGQPVDVVINLSGNETDPYFEVTVSNIPEENGATVTAKTFIRSVVEPTVGGEVTP